MTKTIALRIEVPADDDISVDQAKTHIRSLLRKHGAVALGDAGPENLAGELPLLFLSAADVKQGTLPEARGKARPRRPNGGSEV
jgi:hypothetical protein